MPDLNPVEMLCTDLKGQELANLAAAWWLPYGFTRRCGSWLVSRNQADQSG